MRILISNDDGIAAPGLAALYAAVADMGEVVVAAPEGPQSASGHSITLHRSLVVERMEVKCSDGVSFEGISIDGRPADCVRLAIRSLMAAPPDLVLSGINAGSNVGINVLYSGTVAAAAEGAMLAIPAVAFSAPRLEQADLSRAARLCRHVLERLLANGLTRGDLVNVNIPILAPPNPRGIRLAAQSTSGIEDLYDRVEEPDNRERYRLGDKFRFMDSHCDSDVAALAEGYITVTPLHVDMTNHDRMTGMEHFDWGKLP